MHKRKYNTENKRLYDIRYRAEHKEQIKQVRTIWRRKNRAKINAWKLKWSKSENGKASRRRWHARSDKSLWRLYKAEAERRKLDFSIPLERFVVLIHMSCFYCGKTPVTRHGLDRVDNTKGYLEENVVPCCFVCNQMKGKRTVREFIDHVVEIINHVAS